ncbi:MAG: pectate lyase [Janthinobacterium lividum]
MKKSFKIWLCIFCLFCFFNSDAVFAQVKEASAKTDPVAENMLLYQRKIGGWPKAVGEVKVDYNRVLSPAERASTEEDDSSKNDATIDNNATSKEILYLLKAYKSTQNKAYLQSAQKGIDYILMAQNAKGGWPQYYPDSSLYRAAITYNDNAMINVMEVLQDVVTGAQDFDVVDPSYKTKAQTAVNKGLECILKTQIVVDGKLTAWAQQYDKNTLKPVMARKFELIGLASSESAAIVEFLIHQKNPSPEIKKAVEAAVKWFDLVKIKGYSFVHIDDSKQPKGKDAVVRPDPNSIIWSRYYEIGTNKPFFAGRNSLKVYAVAEIENERRTGYAWYGIWPQKVLDQAYPKWKKQNN